MIYHNLYWQVEAVGATVAGERYYVAMLDGKPHLIPGSAFELLFGAEIEANPEKVLEEGSVAAAEAPKVEVRRQLRPPNKPKGEPKGEPKTGKLSPSPLQQRVLDILSSGPLTTADLATAVYTDVDRKTACMNIYPLTAGMKDKGLIAKREDAAAGGLMKWFKS